MSVVSFTVLWCYTGFLVLYLAGLGMVMGDSGWVGGYQCIGAPRSSMEKVFIVRLLLGYICIHIRAVSLGYGFTYSAGLSYDRIYVRMGVIDNKLGSGEHIG